MPAADLYMFLAADEKLQHRLTMEQGVFTSRVQSTFHTYTLYAVNDFFVEVITDADNTTISMSAFINGRILDKYLTEITLDGL